MTITEQLQFSVLTAPVATLDRRTLSQAWYSALYGAGAKPAATRPAARAACERGTSCSSKTTEACGQRAAVAAKPRGTCVRIPALKKTVPQAPAMDRRAPRSALARKIERVLLRPRANAHKTSFTVESEYGRVRVLLASRGTQMKLVAICSPKARAHVAAALAQARYALALRGIDLDAAARGAQQ